MECAREQIKLSCGRRWETGQHTERGSVILLARGQLPGAPKRARYNRSTMPRPEESLSVWVKDSCVNSFTYSGDSK